MNQVLGFVVVWSLVSILGIEGVLIETTTLPALAPCKCLGDADLLAVPENAKKVLKTCLQAKSRLTADALGYIAEKYRCGSRTPSLPTMDPDSVCYCKNQTEQVPIENAYLVEYTLINENAAHRWEFYKYQATKRLELNRMDEPESPQFINLKQRVEEMFNNAFVTQASAVEQQFVRAAVMRFQKKIGCMGCPATTTTTTTTTTAASTSAGAPAAVTAAAPAETAAPAARKKRAATAPPATTIPINYDSYYITVFMEVQFMKPVADFQSMFTTVLPTVEEFGTSAVPANVTFPAPGVCKNINLTELLPSTMPSMTHDKQIILVNKTKRFPNDTEILDANGSPQVMMFNATTPEREDRNFLKPGQNVNMWCKNPAQKPS
ncbi:uncharacterized protein LOC111712098 [Eurytemora carolleeae]|uniref:uncharacterized protein LOC111712098 n=1 Tax=Eurytemora carolleeae TaxID=1294199 RepID=UPI000C783E7C|nr:uncharacterized protein LOC111712098 [Eurytemora carolleeae]|eukprot:XP_023342384.1 uncharacterized protein LOC111712098 [Eurytemora affinis]